MPASFCSFCCWDPADGCLGHSNNSTHFEISFRLIQNQNACIYFAICFVFFIIILWSFFWTLPPPFSSAFYCVAPSPQNNRTFTIWASKLGAGWDYVIWAVHLCGQLQLLQTKKTPKRTFQYNFWNPAFLTPCFCFCFLNFIAPVFFYY